MARSADSEAAVRNYLTFVADPARLVDEKAVAALEREVEETTDPIAQLKALARLERALNPVEVPYKQAFLEHAKAWAEANDVPPPAFLRMGVSEEVLRAAGIAVDTLSSRPGGANKRPVPVDEVTREVLRLRRAFTLEDIRTATTASQMTVRKALKELISLGKVRRIGPDPTWTKPGRAPDLYETT